MSEIPVFFLHGLGYAGLLFLVSAGLTLVFGMMNVLNFAHAAMYMLGAYFSFSILMWSNQFWLSLIVCPILLFIIGAVVERFFLRRVHVFGHVHELLLTFGLAYIITEIAKWVWGNYPLAVNIGGFLNGTVKIFDFVYPIYRIFIFFCGALVGLIMALICVISWGLVPLFRFITYLASSPRLARTRTQTTKKAPATARSAGLDIAVAPRPTMSAAPTTNGASVRKS